MLGKPKYRRNDQVNFEWKGSMKTGKIWIVDSYGTFFQKEEPSYDIMVEGDAPGLYKHVPESMITGIAARTL